MRAIENAVLILVEAMAPTPPVGATVDSALDSALVDDLGYDSLRLLELSIAAEQAFALPPVSPDKLVGIVTVRDLAEFVRAQQDQP